MAPGVLAARLAAVFAVGALGACSAAAAAIAVAIGPGRSVILTAFGVVAVLATFGAIMLLVRHRASGTQRG